MDIAIRARAIQDVVFERPQVTEQMAASLGISARTWRNNLMGKFAISGLTVMRLIATHHVSAAWLLAGTGAMFEGAVARSVRPSRVA